MISSTTVVIGHGNNNEKTVNDDLLKPEVDNAEHKDVEAELPTVTVDEDEEQSSSFECCLYTCNDNICSRRLATLRSRRSYDHDNLHTHVHCCLQFVVLFQHCLDVILLEMN